MTSTVASSSRVAGQQAFIHPTGTARFTLDGSDELEDHLAGICDRFLEGVRCIVSPHMLEGLLLGGGYGRGEGGVLTTESGDQPYNDLEFYVCLRGNRFLNERRYQPLLQELAEQLSRNAGVEVEFKIFSIAQLRHGPPSMFYYDLLMGHRWICGDESLLNGCDHHRHGSGIPVSEATRLLMNRCSGLLFARERLQRERFTAEDSDFVGRNLAKAQLAFGDAMLTAFGLYDWSCLARHNRVRRLRVLEGFPWLEEVVRHHAAGVEFKLHPYRASAGRTALRSQHRTLAILGLQLWLWLEHHRLGQQFESAIEYALAPSDKCPETNAWRNRLVNARTFGPKAFLHWDAKRHPRDKVLRALALLLWEDVSPQRPELLRQVQGLLQTNASGFSDLVQAYRAFWRLFN